jgi:hypothetical protein
MTAIEIVIANCLYNSPVMPPKNPTGTNTAHSTNTIAMTGPVTSSIARLAAFFAESRPCVMCRSQFSTTTIASSTTIPIASTMPNRVKVLIEKPKACIPAKVPTRETGTATPGIKVARQLWRKR